VNPSTPPTSNHFPPNPFLPRKNFATGRWAGANISLRRQAELVKLAKKHDVEELLPPGHKSTAWKQQRLLEQGLRIRGTGEGQKVKGHMWERTMGTRLDKRRKAMENMPSLIREWESVRPRTPFTISQTHANNLSRKVTAEDGRNTPSLVLDVVLQPLFNLYAMLSHQYALLSSEILIYSEPITTALKIWSTSHVHLVYKLQNCSHSNGLLVSPPSTQD